MWKRKTTKISFSFYLLNKVKTMELNPLLTTKPIFPEEELLIINAVKSSKRVPGWPGEERGSISHTDIAVVLP